MTDAKEIARLKRKIARLEAKLRESDAVREMAEMMALDCAPEGTIARIEREFPEIVAGWRKRNPERRAA